MSENTQRSRGRPGNYKLDRGGVPSEGGPFLGTVMNNIDPTRSGRLQVFIDNFNDGNMNDTTKWTTVDYLPSFYGATPKSGTSSGAGTYPGNRNSYGMWFTPPDVGVTVVCIFINGDRDQGYYIGVVPEQGINHMIPAIGAATNFVPSDPANVNQLTYLDKATQAPVTEINDSNLGVANNPRFFDQPKPVHSVLAAAMFQQGLINDPERGPIGSSSQRESPSAVFGISTPGISIYQGGASPSDIRKKIEAGELKPQDVKVIGRMGGHTLTMDDGNIDGNNALFRLRSAKGHQITMSDSGDFFYIIHANGQTWVELGKEGTLDVFSTNSVNVRTQGDINLHADRDINMYAGRNINAKSKENITLEAELNLTATAQENLKLYSKSYIGVLADGTLALNSAGSGSWNGGSTLIFSAGGIDLNGPSAATVPAPRPLVKTVMDDTEFNTSTGWQTLPNGLESIVSRAPTHEPYSYHNEGVDVKVALEEGTPTPPPGAEPVPAGVEIRAE
jgi:hypothetical protein